MRLTIAVAAALLVVAVLVADVDAGRRAKRSRRKPKTVNQGILDVPAAACATIDEAAGQVCKLLKSKYCRINPDDEECWYIATSKTDATPVAPATACDACAGQWTTDCLWDQKNSGCDAYDASTDPTCWYCVGAPATACDEADVTNGDECVFAGRKECRKVLTFLDLRDPVTGKIDGELVDYAECYYAVNADGDVIPPVTVQNNPDTCGLCDGFGDALCVPNTMCTELEQYNSPSCWFCQAVSDD
eukprot:m.351443 g.351443  ORF g.351443 m.351443 type:complete len:245 (+) comp16242_c0_seq1:149-883(+)